MAARGAERYGVHNSPARAGPPLSDRLPQYSPGPRAGATAEVGIVKFDRPPPPAHPTPQSGSGQAGSDCARPGKTGLRVGVAEGPGQRLRVSGGLNLRVPGLLLKSFAPSSGHPLSLEPQRRTRPPGRQPPIFRPRKSTPQFSVMSPGPGARVMFVCFVLILISMPRGAASV